MTPDELKKRRTRLGLSQAQHALALPRPVDTIHHWEQGRRRIEMPGVLAFVLDALKDDRARFGADQEAWIASLPDFLRRDPS